jgi:hypothetical protein
MCLRWVLWLLRLRVRLFLWWGFLAFIWRLLLALFLHEVKKALAIEVNYPPSLFKILMATNFLQDVMDGCVVGSCLELLPWGLNQGSNITGFAILLWASAYIMVRTHSFLKNSASLILPQQLLHSPFLWWRIFNLICRYYTILMF